MFHFIKFKLQSVGKQKTDLGVVLWLAGLITPTANTGLPDHLFKRHGRWAGEVAKDGNVQDSLSSRLSVSNALGWLLIQFCENFLDFEKILAL